MEGWLTHSHSLCTVTIPHPSVKLQSDWLSSDSLGAEHQNKTREQHHSLFYIFLLKKIHPTYPTPVVLLPRICTHLERQESLILAAMEDSWWATDPGKSGTSPLSDTRPKLTLCPDLYVPSCPLGLYPDCEKGLHKLAPTQLTSVFQWAKRSSGHKGGLWDRNFLRELRALQIISPSPLCPWQSSRRPERMPG